ncbi:MAG: ral secretion pathway protein [bacterium]|nr:ral secretion pathway protein [bacterium]
MTRTTSERRAAAGFTLVELLIAVTLLSLLSVALLVALRVGVRAERAGSVRLEAEEGTALALSFIRAQLGDSRAALEVDETGRSVVVFEGAADHVAFVAPLPARVNLPGLHLIEIAAVRAALGSELVIRARPYRPQNLLPADISEKRLIPGLGVAEFAYFGAVNSNEPASWHGEWHDMLTLPALVRLRVSDARGEAAPDLVVALRSATRIR